MKGIKKHILIMCLIIWGLSNAIAAPQGLWQSKERLVLFEENALNVVLKPFYGWYYDGAAAAEPRIANNTTANKGRVISLSIVTLEQDNDSFEGELHIKYEGLKEEEIVPFAIIGDGLYLNFAHIQNIKEDGGVYLKFFGTSRLIGLSPRYKNEEINCLYLVGDKAYSVRYWLMEKDYKPDAKATFEDEGASYTVDKDILSGGRIYTCTNSRETKIRHVSKIEPVPNDIVYNEAKTLAARGAPYLTRVDTGDKSANETLSALIKEANARRYPIAPLVFPLEGKSLTIEPFGESDNIIRARQSPR